MLSLNLRYFLLVLNTLIFPLTLIANCDRPESITLRFRDRVQLNDLETKSQIIAMNVKRFPNQDGTPMIISHAFSLSNESVVPLGKLFCKLGFDVWMPNMRGHGINDERTILIPYTWYIQL